MSQVYLILLLIIYAAMMLFSILLSRRDVTAPGVIFYASFVVMLFMSILFDWYFHFGIKSKTFWVMTIAAVFFFLGENGFRLGNRSLQVRMPRVYRQSDQLLAQERPIIRVNAQVKLVVIAFMLLSTLLSLYMVLSHSDGGSWSDRITQFKSLQRSGYFQQPGNHTLIFIRNRCTEISHGFAYVFGYILVYNKVIYGTPIHKQKTCLIVALLFVLMTLEQAAREGAIEYIFYLFLLYPFLIRREGKKIEISKTAVKVILLFFVFAYTFVFLASRVGRGTITTAPMVYFAVYVCGGLDLFNGSVIDKPFSTSLFGQATFSGLYATLIDKFHLFSGNNLSYHYFGDYGNNTVMIYGRWYEDFGAVGVMVMTAIVAVFFSWLYEKAKKRSAPSLAHVMYVKLLLVLVLASYDDHFTFLLSVNTMFYLTYIAIFYRLMIGGGKYRFVFGERKLKWANLRR